MRLVLCDDHLLLLEAMATALGRRGYTVEAVTTTPAEAVYAVALHAPDVLLIDVTFPVGSGLDAARQVVDQHPGTKVVMMTATEAPEPLLAALEIGVSGYIQKAQRVDAIARALERAAHGELAVDPELLRRVRGAVAGIPRSRTSLDALTPREQHVLALLVNGDNTKEMVRQLGVSQSTVRTHVQNIFTKLGVHTRLQAVASLTTLGMGDRSRLVHVSGE